MSTAKRLVLSLRGRKHSQSNTATSSTRLVSAGTSPGHELDEIAVVSGSGGSSHHLTYGGIGIGSSLNDGPRYSTVSQPSPTSSSLHSDDGQEEHLQQQQQQHQQQVQQEQLLVTIQSGKKKKKGSKMSGHTGGAGHYSSLKTHAADLPPKQQKPRASYPEIMHPRLSLNGAASTMLRHLVPSPRPLYRETSSRSIQPLTAAEQQMAELDGGSFYGVASGCYGGVCGGSGSGGGGGGGGSGGGGGGGSAGGGFHTTDLSITPTMTGDEQYIDLGSLRRFSIDRHSFLDLGSKFGMSQPKFGQSVSQQGFFTSHDSLSTSCVTRASNPHVATVSTASELDLTHHHNAGNSFNYNYNNNSHNQSNNNTINNSNTNSNSNKQRHKSRGRLKTMSGEQPLLGSWSRSTTRGSQDNTLGGPLSASNFCNGTDRYPRSRSGCSTALPSQSNQQQQHQQPHHPQHGAGQHSHQQHYGHQQPAGGHHPHQQPHHQQQQQQQHSQQTQQPHHRRTASQRFRAAAASKKFTFVFDPAGRLCYYWSMVVSLAFLYNFWVIIYRFAFQEINRRTIVVWFCLDYLSDFLYLIDILFHFRTGYLEDGVLQTDSSKLRQHYMNSTTFYIDCLCLLPLDFLYLSIGFNSILRSFRLVKIYRFWAFMDRTERHTNYPNLFRSTSLIHYLLVIFHWNGCLYHIIHKNNGFGSRNWVYHDSESADVVKQYLQSYYWCTLALTTIGDLPKPRSKGEYVFVILQLLFGLMLFATVLGHVANIVTSVSAARKEFQAKLDGVKTYMRMRRVPNHLQVKVIKWFDYLWLTQKCSDEERAVSCLPDKLKAEIAINVHLDTLKRVEIFQNTEAGFLCELVLRLRPVLFSPGDYICRKGEVGKEMYIVNRGRLQVVADNGKTVMASLKAGSYFGEISILNMGTAGNRRTASVRSVGYSDLFVLSKKDMWDVLKEYPAARVRLESIAVKRLEKYKKAPLEKVAMGRCQSTPGLVESEGRTTLEDMWLPPHAALPANQQSLAYSRAASPRLLQQAFARPSDSPGSMSPSVHSSDDRPRSRAASHQSTRPQSQPSRSAGHICDSSSHLECYGAGPSAASGTTPLLGSHEALEDEIKRLRERLHTVESENQALNTKLSQQQWDLENRLAEIEMQICGVSSTSSLDPEHEAEEIERNRESII